MVVKYFSSTTAGGWGESTAIGRILIREDGCNVVVFNSSRQYPINHRPFGFVKAELSLDDIIAYLATSRDHCAKNFKERIDIDAWREVSKAYNDIEEIKDGKWPLPE